MKALLIRHAQSSGQAADADLSETGQAQAIELASVLAALAPTPVYASSYARAQATIAPYASATDQQIQVLEGLRERLLTPVPLPDWKDHIQRSFEDPDHAAPGGESVNDIRARAANELIKVQSIGGSFPVIVSHGGMISALFQACDPTFGFEDWQNLRNPDIFEVTISDGEITAFQILDLNLSEQTG